jgi:hypothetical protein
MKNNLSPEIQRSANEAAAPILLAAGGALTAPKLDASKAKAALEKLGIPTQGKVLISVAYDLCTTHDFLKLEQAARDNGAKLYIIYGEPNGIGLDNPKNHDKISIGVVEGNKARPVKAEKFILVKDGSRVLAKSEVATLARDLGISLAVQQEPGISSANSAMYENGTFKGVIANGKTTISEPEKSSLIKTGFIPSKRSTATLG